MQITNKQLLEVLGEAYSRGLRTPRAPADGYVRSVVGKLKATLPEEPPAPEVDTNWRLYTIAELNALPVGTTLEHKAHGQCVVMEAEIEEDGTTQTVKCMHFGDRHPPAGFFQEGQSPWDAELRGVAAEVAE